VDEKMKSVHYAIIATIVLIITSISAVIYVINNPPSIPPQVTELHTELVKTIKSPNPAWKGGYGSSLAIGDTRIVVGESGIGHVYIYDYNGSLLKTLTPPIVNQSSGFGSTVAINEAVIVVGEPRADVDGLKSAGLIHIYDIEGNYVRTVKSQFPYEGAGYGFSLVASGGVIVVGEPGPFNGDEALTTRVYLLGYDGGYIAVIERPQQRKGSFGWDVGISEGLLAVGEPYAVVESPTAGYTHGVVHLYDVSRSAEPVFVATIKSPTGRGFGSFGMSVSVGKDIVAIGEIRGDFNSTQQAGSVQVYTRKGEFVDTLTSPSPKTYGYFGLPVEVTDNLMAVGQRNGGFAYLYDHEGHLLSTVSQDGLAEGNFGGTLALFGSRLVVGAPISVVDGMDAGKVYLFNLR
jgi:hypothetical protein